MVASTQYSGNYYGQTNPYSIQLTVPLSTSCPSSGNLLWAVGTVYDTYSNINIGSSNAPMSLVNGYYSGQLVFAVPLSVVGHQLQVQIQVYNSYVNGQFGGLVATSSPTVTVNPSGYYPPTGTNGYYNGAPNGYFSNYYYYYGYPTYNNGYPYYYYNNGYPSYSYPYPSYSYPYYYYSSPYYHYGSGCYYGPGYYAGCHWHYHHHP